MIDSLSPPPSPPRKGQTRILPVTSLGKFLTFLCLDISLFCCCCFWFWCVCVYLFMGFETGSPCVAFSQQQSPCLHNTPAVPYLQFKRSWWCKTVAVPPGIWQTPATQKWPCKDRCIFMTGTTIPCHQILTSHCHDSHPPACPLGIALSSALQEVADARLPSG